MFSYAASNHRPRRMTQCPNVQIRYPVTLECVVVVVIVVFVCVSMLRHMRNTI